MSRYCEMWQLPTVHMKRNVGSDQGNLKSFIDSFIYPLFVITVQRAARLSVQIKHGC